jgi:hypothetical protein
MQGFWESLADLQFWLLFVFVAIPIVLAIGWRVAVVVFWLLLALALWPLDKILMLVSPAYRARGTLAADPSAPRPMSRMAIDKAQRQRLERRLAKARKRAAAGVDSQPIDR